MQPPAKEPSGSVPPIVVALALAATGFFLWPQVSPYLSDDPQVVREALNGPQAPVEPAPTSIFVSPAPPRPTTDPALMKWTPIRTFVGRGVKNTPRFSVSSPEWRVRWKAKGDGNFIVNVNGADGMSQAAANIIGDDEDESYVYGAGEFYLEITASEPYIVWVETPG